MTSGIDNAISRTSSNVNTRGRALFFRCTRVGVFAGLRRMLYRPLWTERLARAIRVPWQTITLRRPRQR
jgi:hypothetical protein